MLISFAELILVTAVLMAASSVAKVAESLTAPDMTTPNLSFVSGSATTVTGLVAGAELEVGLVDGEGDWPPAGV